FNILHPQHPREALATDAIMPFTRGWLSGKMRSTEDENHYQKWVLPEPFVRHGHCAPQCFPSYKFSNLGNR
ncbi:hypothetical protein QQG30_26430, partial [Klebsiella pneumoniae]|uniref:hypothetical protein n=1 Tax=Klebsiella pneumoniae TaxID=573 RepID=UPI0034595C4D